MSASLRSFVVENPTLIRGRAYDKIKQEILSGSIPPDFQVFEGRLAKELKVSRTPVREALHVLEMEGFLESFPRVGYRVRRITWEEAIEINEIRAVLEPLAAKKAIESGDQSYVDVLEEVIAESESALKEQHMDIFFDSDAAFDEIIIRASAMKALLDIWATLRQRLRLYRLEAQGSIEMRHKAIIGHRRIMKCLKARDGAAVERAIRAHLEDSKQDIRRITLGAAQRKAHLQREK